MAGQRSSSFAALVQDPVIPDLDRPFLLDSAGAAWSLREYRDQVARATGVLRNLGVAAGNLVSWQMPTGFDALVLTAALAAIGARQNPILPLYGARELAFVIDECRPDFFLAATLDAFDAARPGLANQPEAVLARPGLFAHAGGDCAFPTDPMDADAVRWLFYSSGTTANPKGAMHTDASIIAGPAALVERYALTSEDRYGMIFPFSHVGGLQMLIAQLLSGASAILFERFAGDETFSAMREMGVTLLSAGTPGAQVALAAQRRSPETRLFPRLRAVMTGAAPKPAGLHQTLCDEMGGTGALSCYGLTEAPMGVLSAHDDPDDARAHTEGKPIPGAMVRVVASDGHTCTPGEVGEIRVMGPQLMRGYVDARLNADAFDDQGFLRTGDLGSIDERGFVRVVGRLKDVIIRKGENISAAEVEDVLARHPGVAEVAAIGLPDEVSGEICCLVVKPLSGHDAPDLAGIAEFCREAGLARYKTPERLELVDDMPRNASGKVMKAQLIKRFAAPGGAGPCG